MNLLHSLTILALLASTGPVIAAPAAHGTTTAISVVAKAAAEARKRCHEFMHEDADEYTACIDTLVAEVKTRAAPAERRRLGILYFGWVGANNSARIALPGADAAAQRYLPRFRHLQESLHIADADLCGTIEGNCTTRMAQVREQESAQSSAVRKAAQRACNKRDGKCTGG